MQETTIQMNPIFGKNLAAIKKAASFPFSQSRELQIHQAVCIQCTNHKPCPRSKYRGVNVLETNELQFYIRIMAPARTSDSIQLNSLFTIVNQFVDDTYYPDNFLAYATPDNAYQILLTMSDHNTNDLYTQLNSPVSYHCFSTPIIIDNVIHPDSLGTYSLKLNFNIYF